MHATKRPAGDIRIPIGCEEGKTLLTDIAYFNSLTCKATIRFCSQHVVNKNWQVAKKPCDASRRMSSIQPCRGR
jgi:hypothetical protein